MTKQKKQMRGFSNFGFTTILLSFVMICVATFSALSLVSAYSDYKLSKKVADKTTAYYQAQEKAYEYLARIDDALKEAYLLSTNEASYYELAKDLLSKTVSLDCKGSWLYENEDYTYHFTQTIGEGQTLSVKLKLCYPTNKHSTFYKLLEWRSIYEQQLPGDDHLDVMQ